MKVICINNEESHYHTYRFFMNDGYDIIDCWNLTIGKVYEAIYINNNLFEGYQLFGDNGLPCLYSLSSFITMEEHRKQKLEEIGI